MALTTYGENALLNLFRGTSITAPAHWYIGFFTTQPTAAGSGGVEVSGGSYARVQLETLMGAPTGSVPASSSNSSQITCPTATANWGMLVGWGIFDASSGGNLWINNTFTGGATYVVNTGSTFKMPVGNFTLSVT